jgi:hypothetical protein
LANLGQKRLSLFNVAHPKPQVVARSRQTQSGSAAQTPAGTCYQCISDFIGFVLHSHFLWLMFARIWRVEFGSIRWGEIEAWK